jgi:hypothetical protein
MNICRPNDTDKKWPESICLLLAKTSVGYLKGGNNMAYI